MRVSEQTIYNHRLRPGEVEILETLLLLLGDDPTGATVRRGSDDVDVVTIPVRLSRPALLALWDELSNRRSRS